MIEKAESNDGFKSKLKNFPANVQKGKDAFFPIPHFFHGTENDKWDECTTHYIKASDVWIDESWMKIEEIKKLIPDLPDPVTDNRWNTNWYKGICPLAVIPRWTLNKTVAKYKNAFKNQFDIHGMYPLYICDILLIYYLNIIHILFIYYSHIIHILLTYYSYIINIYIYIYIYI